MRRTFWLAAGFGLGLYAGEKVRRTVVRLTPESFTDRLRTSVQDALDAGRVEMRARERQLRETFAAADQEQRTNAERGRSSRSRTVA